MFRLPPWTAWKQAMWRFLFRPSGGFLLKKNLLTKHLIGCGLINELTVGGIASLLKVASNVRTTNPLLEEHIRARKILNVNKSFQYRIQYRLARMKWMAESRKGAESGFFFSTLGNARFYKRRCFQEFETIHGKFANFLFNIVYDQHVFFIEN